MPKAISENGSVQVSHIMKAMCSMSPVMKLQRHVSVCFIVFKIHRTFSAYKLYGWL